MCQEVIAQDQLCYKKLSASTIIGSIAWSAAGNREKIVQFLIEALDLYRTQDMTELAMTYGILCFIFYSSIKQLMQPAIEFNNKYCCPEDQGDLPGFLHVAAINGNVDVFSTLSNSQVEKQIGQLKDVSKVYSVFFKDNFPEGYTLLNPLHISLLMMSSQEALRGEFILNDKVISTLVYDYTVFCDRLIKACPSIVNEPLPDGRTPLDLVRDLDLEKMAWTLLKWGGQTNPFLGHPNVRHSEQLDKAYRITGIASALKQHTAQSVMSFRSGQLEPSHLKSYLQNKPKISEITDIALSLISDRWLTVGRLLGVDEAFLETTFEAEDTNEKKCRRVLKWWLENCASPSWSKLLSVIEQTDPKQLIVERLRTSCIQPSARMLPIQHSISEPHWSTTFESPHPHRQWSHPFNTTRSGLLSQDQLLFLQQTQILHNSNNTHHHYYPHPPFPQLPPCTSQQLQLYHPHPPQYHNDHPSQSPNIYEVQRDLVDRVAAEWYKLGIVLQVETYVLNNITVNSVQQGVEKCCMDLFMRWLRGDKGTGSLPRTWDTIIPAVETHRWQENYIQNTRLYARSHRTT